MKDAEVKKILADFETVRERIGLPDTPVELRDVQPCKKPGSPPRTPRWFGPAE